MRNILKKRLFAMKKVIMVLSVILFCFLSSYVFLRIKSCPDDTCMVGNRPLLIAHGGSKQLFPENTMLAFDGVTQYNPDVLETDVVLTRDSILICCHDREINRLSNGEGLVVEYTFEELKQYNFAYHFKDSSGNYPYRDTIVNAPKLEDLIAKYGQKYYLNIDLKDNQKKIGESAARELLRILKKYNMEDRAVVASFNEDNLSYFRKISENKIRTASPPNETKNFVIMNRCYVGNFFISKTAALQIPVKSGGHNLANLSLIKKAHQKNIAIHYWTINDKEEMRRLILLGADGIMTDRADILAQLLQEMGYNN
jgi:glycerophosphoryl diester phosphodiesterase